MLQKIVQPGFKNRFMGIMAYYSYVQGYSDIIDLTDLSGLCVLGATWWLSRLAPKCVPKNNYDPVTFYFGLPGKKKNFTTNLPL